MRNKTFHMKHLELGVVTIGLEPCTLVLIRHDVPCLHDILVVERTTPGVGERVEMLIQQIVEAQPIIIEANRVIMIIEKPTRRVWPRDRLLVKRRRIDKKQMTIKYRKCGRK